MEDYVHSDTSLDLSSVVFGLEGEGLQAVRNVATEELPKARLEAWRRLTLRIIKTNQ